MTNAERVARRFSRELRQELGIRTMREVIRRNREEYAGMECCASHDFCDANTTMLRAFALLGIDESTALWNEAWEIAKSNDFFVARPKHARQTCRRCGEEIKTLVTRWHDGKPYHQSCLEGAVQRFCPDCIEEIDEHILLTRDGLCHGCGRRHAER